MTHFLRTLLCSLLGHHEGVTIRYGWAVTRCQRCRAVVATEPLPRPRCWGASVERREA